MPFLSKSFDKIYIFPGDFSDIKIPVPQNVSVVNIYDAAYYKSSLLRLFFALPYLMHYSPVPDHFTRITWIYFFIYLLLFFPF